MSEYIITGKAVERWDLPTVIMAGEIVRCRDCFYYKLKEGQEGCWYFRHSEQLSDYSWHDVPEYVEPNGFCAWGERREP